MQAATSVARRWPLGWHLKTSGCEPNHPDVCLVLHESEWAGSVCRVQDRCTTKTLKEPGGTLRLFGGAVDEVRKELYRFLRVEGSLLQPTCGSDHKRCSGNEETGRRRAPRLVTGHQRVELQYKECLLSWFKPNLEALFGD